MQAARFSSVAARAHSSKGMHSSGQLRRPGRVGATQRDRAGRRDRRGGDHDLLPRRVVRPAPREHCVLSPWSGRSARPRRSTRANDSSRPGCRRPTTPTPPPDNRSQDRVAPRPLMRASRSRWEDAAISSTHASNATRLARDGTRYPLTLRTNCSAAARTSSSVTAASGRRNVLMLRHMDGTVPRSSGLHKGRGRHPFRTRPRRSGDNAPCCRRAPPGREPNSQRLARLTCRRWLIHELGATLPYSKALR